MQSGIDSIEKLQPEHIVTLPNALIGQVAFESPVTAQRGLRLPAQGMLSHAHVRQRDFVLPLQSKS
jgi:hypothetical protein